jgi:hypothetical protein
MAVTDRLLTSLRNDLPGATDAQIIAKLWEVVNIACREGWVWRETIAIPLTEGDMTYYPTPAGSDIVQALSIDHETLDLTDTVYEYGLLQLGTEPSAADVAAGNMYMVAVLAPSLDAGQDPEPLIPEDMWTTMYDMWWKGTMGLMMVQLNRPWTNPGLAQIYYRAFKAKLAEERRRVDLGGVVGGQKWTYPKWA